MNFNIYGKSSNNDITAQKRVQLTFGVNAYSSELSHTAGSDRPISANHTRGHAATLVGWKDLPSDTPETDRLPDSVLHVCLFHRLHQL